MQPGPPYMEVFIIYDPDSDRYRAAKLPVMGRAPLNVKLTTEHWFDTEDEALAFAQRYERITPIRFGIFPKSGEYLYLEREQGSKEPMMNGYTLRKG